jgi:hypothetical protein
MTKAEEAKLIAACRFQPHYSGSASVKFWKEVNHPANDRTLYDFAVALQELESRFLAALNPGIEHRVKVTLRHHRRPAARPAVEPREEPR